MQTGPNDNSIISRVLQGEQQAYAVLVKRYQNFVFTSCLTFLRKKRPDIKSLDEEHVFAAADTQHSGLHANQVEQKSRVAMVNDAIRLLGPDDGKIITLFYKGEQSLEE